MNESALQRPDLIHTKMLLVAAIMRIIVRGLPAMGGKRTAIKPKKISEELIIRVTEL